MKLFFIIFTVLLFASQAYADHYLLVMSKNDQVCQQMYKLYNTDMQEHGNIAFENHEEYNWLKWDYDINLYNTYQNMEIPAYDNPNIGGIASFDINNDENNETVLFERMFLSGILHDTISFFHLDFYRKFKEKLNTKDLPPNRHTFPSTQQHNVMELPTQKIFDSLGDKIHLMLSVGTFSYVRPLKIDSQYFISIFASEGQDRIALPLEKTNVILISKYNENNNMQNVCYFIRTHSWKKQEECR